MGRNKLLVLYVTCLFSLLVTVFAKKKLVGPDDLASKEIADNVVVGDESDAVDEVVAPNTQHKKLQNQNHVQEEEDCWKSRKRLHDKANDLVEELKKLESSDSTLGSCLHDYETDGTERNEEILRNMLKTRAGAERAVVDVGGDINNIPAGINLGSYGIMRMKNAILFFHRMKLRNMTFFRITKLKSSISDMTLSVDLNLNDLHLVGDYERCLLDRSDIRKLYFMPNYGELNLLLKNVKYSVHGHYRYVQDRFYVEHIQSTLFCNNILMTYANTSECVVSTVVEPQAIQEFLERLKADLDAWLKDYFNDFFLYYNYTTSSIPKCDQPFKNWRIKRDQVVNEFTDFAISMMKSRIVTLKPSCASVATPDFTLISVNGVKVQLTQGALRGMNTFYRQGMATVRAVVAQDPTQVSYLGVTDIGFSSLTLEYRYTAIVNQGVPPLTGMFRLDANDLMFHLFMDLSVLFPNHLGFYPTFQFIRQKRPQTLVIEGPINRYISNWKHLLEDEIIALMTNTILYHVKQLSTILNCVPQLTCLEPSNHSDSSDSDPDHPDYGAVRNDSIEIELPEDGKHPAKKLKIRYYESVKVKQMHDLDRRMAKSKKSKKPKSLRTQEEKKRSLKRKEHNKEQKKKERLERIEESKRLGKELPLKDSDIKADDDSSVSHSYQADD